MTINKQQVKVILDQLLGGSTMHRNGELSYHCPLCNHYKRKLQINLETEAYHCWICDAKGRKLTTLLKKINAPQQAYQVVKEVYGESKSNTKTSFSRELVGLPEGYRPLHQKQSSPDYKNALHYALNVRKLTPLDILRYRVGYCEEGPYAGMLIIPSYGADNTINYYVGRSYYNATISHKNPPVSKDIIGFENMINWKRPIVIVEGAFDAIATKRNAIPLFGKKMLPNLRTKILTEKVQKLYLALDKDALKDSIKEVEYFMNNGIDVYMIQLLEKDPSDMGYVSMIEAINKAKKVDFFDLIKYKMSV
jgi:DNA primase